LRCAGCAGRQDFLGGISGPDPIPDSARVGDYAELQVGPAFTQMQVESARRASPVCHVNDSHQPKRHLTPSLLKPPCFNHPFPPPPPSSWGQTFDLPNGQPLQWTEYFGAFDGSPSVLLGANYSAALGEVVAWRTSPTSGVNDSTIADVDAFLSALADTPVDEVGAGAPSQPHLCMLRRLCM
jgi:hypothetical protein